MQIRIFLLMVLALILVAVISAVRHENMSIVPTIDTGATVATSTDTTASSTAACALNECPFDIYPADNGKTFTYVVTSRFTIHLNEATDPKASLSCIPAGVIGYVSNEPPPQPPLYSARFEGVAPGTCVLSDNTFWTTIHITE